MRRVFAAVLLACALGSTLGTVYAQEEPTPTPTPEPTATPVPTATPIPTATPLPAVQAGAQEGQLTPVPTPACLAPGDAPTNPDASYITAHNSYESCIQAGYTARDAQRAAWEGELVKNSTGLLAWFALPMLVAVVGGFILRGPK